MKLLQLLILFSFILVANSNGQNLSGTWIGTYLVGNVPLPNFMGEISLEFNLNSDSSYSIHSYSKIKISGGYALSECKVSYTQTDKKKLVLEEIEELRPDASPTQCFQKFSLKIKRQGKKIILLGNYTTKNCGSGDIRFDRSD